MRLLALSTILLLFVPYVIPGNVCASGGSGDYGSDDWHKENYMQEMDSTTDCYKAYWVGKFKGHNYAFNASICNTNADDTDGTNTWASINVDTEKGKRDREFKINFSDAKGIQKASLMTYTENDGGCGYNNLLSKGEVGLITVQERKYGPNKCWFIFCKLDINITF